MSAFVHYAQETLKNSFLRHVITNVVHLVLVPFGNIFLKLVWCVARSDIFFTCCLVVLKLISAMNIKKKVIIKSKTKQNTYYDKELELQASKTTLKTNSVVKLYSEIQGKDLLGVARYSRGFSAS